MPIDVKQSTAQSVDVWLADSTDGKTAKTGATLACFLAKYAAASFSSISPTVTERGVGHYDVALTTTHMNTVGLAAFYATASGADQIDAPNIVEVCAFDKTDAVRGTAGTAIPNAASGTSGALIIEGTGTAALSVTSGRAKADVVYWNASAVTSPNTAGTPVVDVTRWLGTTVATPGTAGVPSVDPIRWATQVIPTPNVTGVPKVDPTHWLGTAAATPTVAGIPKVEASSGSLTSIASSVWTATAEGANTYAGIVRLLTSILACKVTDFTTDTLVFKSLDGTKTRATVVLDTAGGTGRLSITLGDLS